MFANKVLEDLQGMHRRFIENSYLIYTLIAEKSRKGQTSSIEIR
jgi:hypothetical protein